MRKYADLGRGISIIAKGFIDVLSCAAPPLHAHKKTSMARMPITMAVIRSACVLEELQPIGKLLISVGCDVDVRLIDILPDGEPTTVQT